MATAAHRDVRAAGDGQWWGAPAEDVAEHLGVDPAVGLSSQHASRALERDGPNALPAEQTVPGWRRFVAQYRTYMQLILLGAAVVSLAIQEWSTGVLLVLINVLSLIHI